MRSKPRPPTSAVALLTAAAVIVQPSAATAAPKPIRPLPAESAHTAQPGMTVTLITGDKVSLVRQADGASGALIKPGPGRDNVVFSTRVVREHVHVVPADADPQLAAGRLDPRLFDVTQLVAFGYDDASTTSLPLIVTGAARSTSMSGSQVTRQLPSIGGVALAQTKSQAPAFWRSLTGTSRVSAAGKVWLSGKARLLDAESNAQIGVPAARAAGYDGRGVTVAVLDSGVDAAHPDLKDVLGETKDFTGSPDGAKDTHGHGTHVASIIAGTGTRSAAYGGVAPRATIIAGKVCGDDACDDAAIIDGMEWAAGKARIVNLSLGTSEGTDGTDPIAQAVNALTASTGTLFVAAAGNSYRSYTVGSPASANAALAVASVGRNDTVSDFSSKGPRVGDHVVKPDIAAPGEAIVAARAAGTTMGNPVDDHYTAASGTSMAAPHVAGVAALLAQARPGWTADRLKAALMSSSAAPGDLDVFHAGAGRVDAARAVSQTVLADGSVSFPYATWPHTGPRTTRTVTYRNEGSAPVTLSLALSSHDAFSLESTTLTVPANGSAQATVVLDPAKLPAAGGAAGARLTATGAGVSVRTAVGVAAEPESYTVRITVLDRDGKPADGDLSQRLYLYNHTRRLGTDYDPDVVDGVATVRVPKGDYAITSATSTPKAGAPDQAGSSTLQILTKYTVDRDSQLTLDARQGARTGISVADRPGAVRRTLNADYLLKVGVGTIQGGLFAGVGSTAELYAVPTKAADGVKLAYGLSAVLGSPPSERRPYQYYLTAVAPEDTVPANPVWKVRTADLARRDVRFRAQGKPALAEFSRAPLYLPGQFVFFGAWTTVALPSTRTEYVSVQPEIWSSAMAFQRPADQQEPTVPFGWIFESGDKATAGKPVREEWNRGVVGPSLAMSPNYSAQVLRYGDQLSAYVPMFAPAAPGQGNHVGFQFAFATGQTSLRLGDGEPVSSPTPGGATFGGLPAEDSSYTFTTSATRTDWIPWSDLSTRTEASWTFRSAESKDLAFLPLMYLRTTGAFDDLNRAPAGPFVLSVDVHRQPGTTSTAKVRRVTVEFSTDDGKTWKRAPVVFGKGNAWRAILVNPRTGFVSLRTTATDSSGDRHSVSVIRAYAIR